MYGVRGQWRFVIRSGGASAIRTRVPATWDFTPLALMAGHVL